MGDFSDTALTGIEAASYDLSTISNDIANVSTIGYKSSKAMFHDLYTGSAGNEPGMGVGIGEAIHSFQEGGSMQTGSATDFKISGDGFFQVKDPSGRIFYSRAGQFRLDTDGYFVNPQGMRLQGYSGEAVTGLLGNLRVDKTPSPPEATTDVDFTGNLNPKTADSFSQTINVIDKGGNKHPVEASFSYDKTAKSWTVKYTVDGDTANAKTSNITFSDDGKIQTGQTFDLNVKGQNIKFDFAKMTGYGSGVIAGPSALPNGHQPGAFNGVDVGEDGKVYARYSNNKTKVIGTIALTHFSNQNNLKEVGGNAWVAESGVGRVTTGVPGSQGLGKLSSGVLERSNVNLSAEFVDMISAQRDFQSNAKVIKTSKTLDETLIDI